MSKTILLADDSVTIRKVVELTFMDESFELIAVSDGSEALARFGAAIDLVIADVHMPGADGYEVCREVKKRSPETPVLLLVGTFESFDEGLAESAGADGHLKKPFDSQDLLGRVHGLLDAPSAGEASEVAPAAAVEVSNQVADAEPAADPAPAEEAFSEAGEEGGEAQAVAEAEPGEAESAASEEPGQTDLSEESIDRIARRVVELLSEDAVREVAWEVIPDLAEVVVKERLRELESQVE